MSDIPAEDQSQLTLQQLQEFWAARTLAPSIGDPMRRAASIGLDAWQLMDKLPKHHMVTALVHMQRALRHPDIDPELRHHLLVSRYPDLCHTLSTGFDDQARRRLTMAVARTAAALHKEPDTQYRLLRQLHGDSYNLWQPARRLYYVLKPIAMRKGPGRADPKGAHELASDIISHRLISKLCDYDVVQDQPHRFKVDVKDIAALIANKRLSKSRRHDVADSLGVKLADNDPSDLAALMPRRLDPAQPSKYFFEMTPKILMSPGGMEEEGRYAYTQFLFEYSNGSIGANSGCQYGTPTTLIKHWQAAGFGNRRRTAALPALFGMMRIALNTHEADPKRFKGIERAFTDAAVYLQRVQPKFYRDLLNQDLVPPAIDKRVQEQFRL